MSRRITDGNDANVLAFSSVLAPLNTDSIIPGVKNRSGRVSLARIQEELEQLKQEAKVVGHEEGYQEGFRYGTRLGKDQGHKDGVAELQQRNADFLCEFEAAVQTALDQYFAYLEKSLASMAVVIAEKILRRDLQVEPGDVQAITETCLKEITHAASARILLNPEAFERFADRRDELMALSPSLKSIEIVKSPGLDDGCVIDTEGGRIDGLVKNQLRSLVETLGLP